MPKIPEGKERLEVYIDKDIANKLREYINNSYRYYTKGLLSAVVQDALAAFLNSRKHQHSSSKINPGRPRTQEICRQLVAEMRLRGFISQIDFNSLANIISEIRGSDERTIKKWISNLVNLGYLKRINYYVYEII